MSALYVLSLRRRKGDHVATIGLVGVYEQHEAAVVAALAAHDQTWFKTPREVADAILDAPAVYSPHRKRLGQAVKELTHETYAAWMQDNAGWVNALLAEPVDEGEVRPCIEVVRQGTLEEAYAELKL